MKQKYCKNCKEKTNHIIFSEQWQCVKCGKGNKRRQGLLTSISELRKIADELDKEVKENIKKYKVSGWGTKFQLNIINKSGDSDGWEFE